MFAGAQVVSIRCSETYDVSTRRESIWGIPLFYVNYSPRVLIQVRFLHRHFALSVADTVTHARWGTCGGLCVCELNRVAICSANRPP